MVGRLSARLKMIILWEKRPRRGRAGLRNGWQIVETLRTLLLFDLDRPNLTRSAKSSRRGKVCGVDHFGVDHTLPRAWRGAESRTAHYRSRLCSKRLTKSHKNCQDDAFRGGSFSSGKSLSRHAARLSGGIPWPLSNVLTLTSARLVSVALKRAFGDPLIYALRPAVNWVLKSGRITKWYAYGQQRWRRVFTKCSRNVHDPINCMADERIGRPGFGDHPTWQYNGNKLADCRHADRELLSESKRVFRGPTAIGVV